MPNYYDREKRGVSRMIDLKRLEPQFVTNDKGNKVAVLLPIDKFQELIEDIEDLAAVAERREEPTISHEQVVEELKRDGLL